jgi:hypothetical protein
MSSSRPPGGSIASHNSKLRPSPRDTYRSRGISGVAAANTSTVTSNGSASAATNTSHMAANINDTSSVTSDSIYSAVSVTSTYRHHHAGPFAPPPRVAEPQPVLVKDAKHQPKTHGSLGILIVGLGGANGTTLLAGVLANRLKVQWHGARGEPMTPNYYGCITQLPPKGVHGGVGYKGRIRGLADVSMAAIGGWVSDKRIYSCLYGCTPYDGCHHTVIWILNSRLFCLAYITTCLTFTILRTFDPPNPAMPCWKLKSWIMTWYDKYVRK